MDKSHASLKFFLKKMEELDFTNLLALYSNKGRNGFNPIMKYAVLTYANMRRVKAIAKNKVTKINEQWEELKAASHANVENEKGILNPALTDFPLFAFYVMQVGI